VWYIEVTAITEVVSLNAPDWFLAEGRWKCVLTEQMHRLSFASK
jgi:hypothetical protein